jgi:methanethiol S-methyltransferase
MRSEYIPLALLWIAYCVIHSALISTSATTLFKRLLNNRYPFYRLFFNIFSLITLIPLVLYSRAPRFQTLPFFAWSGYWRIFGYFLLFVAAALIFCGARHYSLSQFLGLRQIQQNRDSGAMTESGEFDAVGILRVVRHPWYLAVFILLWARDLNTATIMINAILSTYLVIGTILEEKKLVLEFGEKYREYQRTVSMFIPLRWPK